MKRASHDVIIREPARRVRQVGFRCQVCNRPVVTARDIEKNARHVLKAVSEVAPPADIFQLISKDKKKGDDR